MRLPAGVPGRGAVEDAEGLGSSKISPPTKTKKIEKYNLKENTTTNKNK